MSVGISPLFGMVLAVIGILNLVPFLIYFIYKACHNQQRIQRRRNGDADQAPKPVSSFDDVNDCEAANNEASSTTAESRDDEEDAATSIETETVPSTRLPDEIEQRTREEAARAFVAEQESILAAARSRWNNSKRGEVYDSLPVIPPSIC